MLRYFIRKAHDGFGLIPRPRVVVGIPYGVTEVEKMAVRDAARNAGARECHLIEEPMAAAIGAGLPVADATGTMIVDIGGGTTEVAVISLGGIVLCRSIRIAGDEMDQEIIQYARQKHNLLIGERMAEEVKIQAGSAYHLDSERMVALRGRDLVSGLPRSIEISSVEIREAISSSLSSIVDAVKTTIEETPPELVADLMAQGIALAGGGALLANLDLRLSQETKMRVYTADDPLTCVVRGTGEVLDNYDMLHKVEVPVQYAKVPR
jgi:rod shape-determining protein MreB